MSTVRCFRDEFVTGTKASTYSFGDLRLDKANFNLSRSGKVIALEPRAMQTLVFLVEHAGQLVSKEALLNALWKDAFVTPNALTRVVAQLRRALGDDARAPRFIETVPTLGYRFVESVENALPRTLAILPFQYLGDDPDYRYFGLGLADALIIKLSSVRALVVRPTSAIYKYSAGEPLVFHSGDFRITTRHPDIAE